MRIVTVPGFAPRGFETYRASVQFLRRPVGLAALRHPQHHVTARHAANMEPQIVGLSELQAQVVVRCVGTPGKHLPSTGEAILDHPVWPVAPQSPGISHYQEFCDFGLNVDE